jgi:hypothetical protein
MAYKIVVDYMTANYTGKAIKALEALEAVKAIKGCRGCKSNAGFIKFFLCALCPEL